MLELYNRIKKVNHTEAIEDTMEEASPVIRQKQRNQMHSGLNREGKPIGKYRSPAYAKKKNALNPIPGLGVPDLKLTGEFYKGIYSEVRGDKIIIDSTDGKTPALANRFGEEIFGLNKESKAEAVKEIKPVLIKNMKKATGL